MCHQCASFIRVEEDMRTCQDASYLLLSVCQAVASWHFPGCRGASIGQTGDQVTHCTSPHSSSGRNYKNPDKDQSSPPAAGVCSVCSDQQQPIMMARWHNRAATRVSAFTDKLYPRSFIETQYLEMRLAVPGPGTVLTNCYVNVLIRSCGQQRAGHKR